MVGELVTPMIKRAFSRDERNFYNTLANGIDENILYVLSWLKTYEASELLDADDSKFIGIGNEAPWASSFSNEIGYIDLDCLQNFFDFYKVGSRLAYNQYRQTQRYTPQDAEALEILNQYVGDAIYNVNVDSCLGIKDILMMGALTGIGISKLGEKLLQSPYTITPHSGATVDTRCTMISVTEYGRSVNTGLLQGYVNLGVYYVDIKTAGDDRVCDDCLEIEENNPYSIIEAMSLLPVHPDCRCSVLGGARGANMGLPDDFVVDMTDNSITLNDI